ncbi:MAG: hypothetical protein AAGI91_03735 [Bacteroidota bacterium]
MSTDRNAFNSNLRAVTAWTGVGSRRSNELKLVSTTLRFGGVLVVGPAAV